MYMQYSFYKFAERWMNTDPFSISRFNEFGEFFTKSKHVRQTIAREFRAHVRRTDL